MDPVPKGLLRIKTGIGAPLSNVYYLERLGVVVTYRQGDLSDLQNHLTNNQPGPNSGTNRGITILE